MALRMNSARKRSGHKSSTEDAACTMGLEYSPLPFSVRPRDFKVSASPNLPLRMTYEHFPHVSTAQPSPCSTTTLTSAPPSVTSSPATLSFSPSIGKVYPETLSFMTRTAPGGASNGGKTHLRDSIFVYSTTQQQRPDIKQNSHGRHRSPKPKSQVSSWNIPCMMILKRGLQELLRCK